MPVVLLWVCYWARMNANSDKLVYREALVRSVKVYVKGLGLGIPLVALFTLLTAEKTLTANFKTSWDFEGGFTVTHQAIGIVRISVAVLLILGVTALSVFGFGIIRIGVVE